MHALMSARAGGESRGPYASCNLGAHVGDEPAVVEGNRARLHAGMAGAQPIWLNQVHGNRVVRLTAAHAVTTPGATARTASGTTPIDADGALTTEPGVGCMVMVADCLPVLLAAPEGKGVAALHAGWRGLSGTGGDMVGQGIVHTGVQALCEATGVAPQDLQAWLGPCIGPGAFEVGADVLMGFGVDPQAAAGHPRFRARAAVPPDEPDATRRRWWADLPGLASDLLRHLGVQDVSGGRWCTVSEASRFFSYRREGVCGRQAAGIWLG